MKMDVMPKYQQIAVEVASRIANGEYPEGTRISGRSAIAGQYNVSPETARRAFCILSDLEIISAEKGSGMHVISREKAQEYVAQFSSQKNIESIRDAMYESMLNQKKEFQKLDYYLSELLKASEHYRSMNPFAPFQMKIGKDCRFLGKTIAELCFWQNTGATIIGIKRNGALMRSPGPYAQILEDDTIYFICQELDQQKVHRFMLCDEERREEAQGRERR